MPTRQGGNLAKNGSICFTPWHLDAIGGSHFPHRRLGVERTCFCIAAGVCSWTHSSPLIQFRGGAPKLRAVLTPRRIDRVVDRMILVISVSFGLILCRHPISAH